MTAGVVVGLTIYAWKTKSDFTVLGGALAVFGFGLMMFAIFVMLFRSEALTMLYCIVVVILFGFYLIFDTQMIIGEKRYELNDEDYILGALVLYLDIVVLFIYILRILGEAKNNN